MSLSSALRPLSCSRTVAMGGWASGAEGVVSALQLANWSIACVTGRRDEHLGIRWFGHLSRDSPQQLVQPCNSPGAMSLAGIRFIMEKPMSTAVGAAVSSAASVSTVHHAQPTLLKPALDIPPERRAKLADELDDAPGSSGSGSVAAQGRLDRRPQRRTREDSPLADVRSLASTAVELGSDDPEVRAVFDKIVGNLTKSGRKATARRIVLDAVRIMQGHLRKGDLDKIK